MPRLFAVLLTVLVTAAASVVWLSARGPGQKVSHLDKTPALPLAGDGGQDARDVAELERFGAELLSRQRRELEEAVARRGLADPEKADSRTDRQVVDELLRKLEREPPPSNTHQAQVAPSPSATLDARSLLSIAEFEWPPPKASSRIVLPRGLLFRSTYAPRLRDVAQHLREALLVAGYDESGFYRIRSDGFALVTRIERLSDDGAPKREARWSQPDATEPFSLARFMLNLVRPEPGHYRLIVFAVTTETFDNTGRQIRSAEASALLDKGATSLPRRLGELPFTDEHNVVVLIYEFLKENPDATPRLLEPSRFSALIHLQKSAIWAALQP